MTQLESQGKLQLQAVGCLHNSVWALSRDKAGCRVVQQALKVAPKSSAEELVLELHNHVLDAIDSPHANFVLQQIVEVMPVARAAFVADEIEGVAARVARHRYGCRVIIRLLEHFTTEEGTVSLVDEFLTEAHELLRHPYAHFVLQAVLEHGLPRHKHQVALALHGANENFNALLHNAMNRHASTVLETALLYCSPEDTQLLAEKILGEQGNVVALAQNQFGCFVLRALLQRPGKHVEATIAFLSSVGPQLQCSKSGKKALESLGIRVEDACWSTLA